MQFHHLDIVDRQARLLERLLARQVIGIDAVEHLVAGDVAAHKVGLVSRCRALDPDRLVARAFRHTAGQVFRSKDQRAGPLRVDTRLQCPNRIDHVAGVQHLLGTDRFP